MKSEQNSELVVLNTVHTLSKVNDVMKLMWKNCRIKYSLTAARLNTTSLMKKTTEFKKNNKHAISGISKVQTLGKEGMMFRQSFPMQLKA